MLKYILIITALLNFSVLNASVTTSYKTKVVDGIGHGITYNEALNNAIADAIGQLNGVTISQKTFTNDTSIESSRGDKYSYKYNKQISKATKGKLDSYSIVSQEEMFPRKWEVVISAKRTTKRTTYKAPGISPKSRRTVAVLPFHTASRNYKVGSKIYSNKKMSLMVSQSIITDITQSRRFAVVDRTYDYDMAKEFELIKSGQVPSSQRAKLGKKLGADYIIVGTIQSASLDRQTSHNQLTSQSSSKNVAEFIVDYRIIVVGTSQIKWSDTEVLEIDLSDGSSEDVMLQRAIKTLSNNISNQLLSNIYPMQIVRKTPMGEIILNQGGTLVKNGSVFNVYKLGKKLIDPYTKESLGREEIQVGKIIITKVNAKTSYAKVIDGTDSMLKKGYICRRESLGNQSSQMVDNKNWRKASVEVQDGGGVRLPFD